MSKNIQLSDGIELLDGTMFSYSNPDVEGITIQMLADVLSRINRFAGHTKHFYSVAQHAANASLIVAPGHEMDALLHDTAEAFRRRLGPHSGCRSHPSCSKPSWLWLLRTPARSAS